jgi:16S rRNA (guanine966-N2)-methyltransferase
MRVVAGRLRGRALASPEQGGTRPTSDRVRESLFNILAHGIAGFDIEGARVIDLFAGTGALGIEALSRGAAFCLLVDNGAEARGLIRRNVEALALTGVTKIFRRDASDLGPAAQMGQFGLSFLDPPYGRGLGDKALASLAQGGWLLPGAIVALEERAGTEIVLPAGYDEIERRTWGDTMVVLVRWNAAR